MIIGCRSRFPDPVDPRWRVRCERRLFHRGDHSQIYWVTPRVPQYLRWNRHGMLNLGNRPGYVAPAPVIDASTRDGAGGMNDLLGAP